MRNNWEFYNIKQLTLPYKKYRVALLEGELPFPLNPPSGCVFRTRCPKVQNDCHKEKPKLISLNDKHRVACPFHDLDVGDKINKN